jgi:hypothetical protein
MKVAQVLSASQFSYNGRRRRTIISRLHELTFRLQAGVAVRGDCASGPWVGGLGVTVSEVARMARKGRGGNRRVIHLARSICPPLFYVQSHSRVSAGYANGHSRSEYGVPSSEETVHRVSPSGRVWREHPWVNVP